MPDIYVILYRENAKPRNGVLQLFLDSAVLDGGSRCEVITGLQSVGRRRFQRAIAKWFKQVASQPNIFYMTPSRRSVVKLKTKLN